MPFVSKYTPDTVDWVRLLFETAPYSVKVIAARTQVPFQTIRCWARRYGWRRPPRRTAPKQTKPSPRRKPPISAAQRRLDVSRRVFTAGTATDADLAILFDCTVSRLRECLHLAGWTWTGSAGRDAPAAMNERARLIAALEATAANAAIDPAELRRLLGQALPLKAADAFAGRDPEAETASRGLERLTKIAGMLADRPGQGDNHETERPRRSLAELREELYGRLARLRAERRARCRHGGLERR